MTPHFPTWNHWPVNQIPSDGRFALFPDHFSSAAILSPKTRLMPSSGPEPTRSTYFLFELTNEPIAAVAKMDRSWLQPPAVTVAGEDFRASYDPAQRAYILTRQSAAPARKSKLELSVSASDRSPAVNPAFVIKNWGDAPAEVRIDGATPSNGKVRIGLVHHLDGTDLIVWIQYQSAHPFRLTFAGERSRTSSWELQ
jgi:hypothetical protein